MERKHELIGKVVSTSNDKTITVLVETYTKTKLYGKRAKYSKKYAAHDVKIVETRPLSKTKHHRLVEIVEKAVIL